MASIQGSDKKVNEPAWCGVPEWQASHQVGFFTRE